MRYPVALNGSSPRSRGTYLPEAVAPSEKHPTVHPRARGEHVQIAMAENATGINAGSSPRSRGTSRTPATLVNQPLIGRFIPALAGNIITFADARGGPQEYGSSPRSRGTCQSERGFQHMPKSCGSSPRSRGTSSLHQSYSSFPMHRFIPALAGNIHFRDTVDLDCLRFGSSPRSRGTYFS